MSNTPTSAPLRRVCSLLLLGAAVPLAAGGCARAESRSLDPPPESPADPSHVAAAELPLPELPLEVNGAVRDWVERFTGREKPYFGKWLAREARYSAMIRAKLRERGMPEDLLYLAMVESGFLPRARSPAEAWGLWQFLDGTARDYGLTVNAYVDERRDPLRATDAALDYLDYLHRRFGSWYLAAAAYNAGENRVARILRTRAEGRMGEENLFWEILEHLPRETQAYVPRMIAAATVAKERERYGIRFEPYDPYEFERVFVPGLTPLRKVAEAAGVPAEVLRELNLHLVRGVTPPGVSYPVRIPRGTAAAVVRNLGPTHRWTMARVDD